MANHKSAQKRIRQTEKRTVVNLNRVNRIRSFVKKVEEAITGGNKTAAQEALRVAQPEIMRGTSKGVLKRNTAARKVSRLSARVQAMSA